MNTWQCLLAPGLTYDVSLAYRTQTSLSGALADSRQLILPFILFVNSHPFLSPTQGRPMRETINRWKK